jgi:chorismate-pyruvate lyase
MPAAARLVRFRPSERPSRPPKRILYPLDYVYSLIGLPSPSAHVIGPGRIPEPYASLLAHDGDMTRTLERRFGGTITIRTMSAHSRGRWYFRRVLLALERSGRPVCMGAVRIAMDVFGARVRAGILRGEVPLGRVLRDAGLDYRSRPRQFLEVTPNAEIMGVFWMREPRSLYGRQTVVTLGGAKIGNIVEVLPLV